jgi:protease I
MAENLQGLRVAILVANGFEQVELEKPQKALTDAGATTSIISPETGSVRGMNHTEKGDVFVVEMDIGDANPDDFDAVLLPGGVVNADKLRMNEEAQRFVQEIESSGKPIAVICHGPWLLVSAGLVEDRHLTSYYTLQDDIMNAGCEWTDEETVVDRNWVSSRQPDDIPAFNKAMLKLFAQNHKNARAAGGSH